MSRIHATGKANSQKNLSMYTIIPQILCFNTKQMPNFVLGCKGSEKHIVTSPAEGDG